MGVHDLPATAFPFTVAIWAAGADRRDEPTWSAVCASPGGVQIPAMGEGAWTRVSFADGDVQIVPPPGARVEDF